MGGERGRRGGGLFSTSFSTGAVAMAAVLRRRCLVREYSFAETGAAVRVRAFREVNTLKMKGKEKGGGGGGERRSEG